MGTVELIIREWAQLFKISCFKCGAKREQKMIEIKDGYIICSNCKRKL